MTTRRCSALIAATAALTTGSATIARAAAPPSGAAPLLTLTGGPVVPHGFYRLVVDGDGHAVFTQGAKRRTLTVGAARMRMLRDDLAAAGFAHLKTEYVRHGPPFVGAYPERVTHAGRTVTVAPGAKAPRGLTRLISALEAIVSRAQAHRTYPGT